MVFYQISFVRFYERSGRIENYASCEYTNREYGDVCRLIDQEFGTLLSRLSFTEQKEAIDNLFDGATFAYQQAVSCNLLTVYRLSKVESLADRTYLTADYKYTSEIQGLIRMGNERRKLIERYK